VKLLSCACAAHGAGKLRARLRKEQAGQRSLRFARFPKRAQSRRLLVSREQDQVNHSHKYFAMATLRPALVLALERVRPCRDEVQRAKPSGEYLPFSSFTPSRIFSCPCAKASFLHKIPLARKHSRQFPRTVARDLSLIPTSWYTACFSLHFLQVPSNSWFPLLPEVAPAGSRLLQLCLPVERNGRSC